jgi:hypothetical protein
MTKSRWGWRALVVSMALVITSAALSPSSWALATSPDSWASTYCFELDQWRSEMGRIVPRVQQIVAATTDDNVANSQKALAKVYRGAADSSHAFVDEMKEIGPPEVANGKKILRLVTTTYIGMATALETAASDVAKPNLKTRKELLSRGSKIDTTLQAEMDGYATGFGKLPTLDTSSDLSAQLTTLSECAPYFGATS